MYASKQAGKSFRGYTCVQVYVSIFGWVRADLMKSENEVHNSLKSLFRDVGVPNPLIADSAHAQVQGRAKEVCNEAQCKGIELKRIPLLPIVPKGAYKASRTVPEKTW